MSGAISSTGAQAALRARPSDDRDEKVKDLQAKVGELTMSCIERLEAMHRSEMSEVHSPSTGRRYSIKRVCAVWQIPRSTVHSQLCRSSLTDAVGEARSEPLPMKNWFPSSGR